MRFTERLVSFAKGWTWNHGNLVQTYNILCIGLGFTSLGLGYAQFVAEDSQGKELLSEIKRSWLLVLLLVISMPKIFLAFPRSFMSNSLLSSTLSLLISLISEHARSISST